MALSALANATIDLPPPGGGDPLQSSQYLSFWPLGDSTLRYGHGAYYFVTLFSYSKIWSYLEKNLVQIVAFATCRLYS